MSKHVGSRRTTSHRAKARASRDTTRDRRMHRHRLRAAAWRSEALRKNAKKQKRAPAQALPSAACLSIRFPARGLALRQVQLGAATAELDGWAVCPSCGEMPEAFGILRLRQSNTVARCCTSTYGDLVRKRQKRWRASSSSGPGFGCVHSRGTEVHRSPSEYIGIQISHSTYAT